MVAWAERKKQSSITNTQNEIHREVMKEALLPPPVDVEKLAGKAALSASFPELFPQPRETDKQ